MCTACEFYSSSWALLQWRRLGDGGQYRGKQIDPDHKSYLITCRFMASDRTLTAEEIDNVVKNVIAACESQLSAKLRA